MLPRSVRRALPAVLAGGLAAGLAAAPPAAAAEACTDVEVVAVRGTEEPGTVGPTLQPLVDALRADLDGSVTVHGLPYRAAPMSLSSPDQGVTMLAERVTARAARCPSMRFVLLGFSQGALVVGDALAGTMFGYAPPRLPESLESRIGAVVVFGNAYYRKGHAYNRGTAPRESPDVESIFPRRANAMATYADRLADYCDAGDFACQMPPTGDDGHTGYARYAADAAEFVTATLGAHATRAPSTPAAEEPATPVRNLLGLACGLIGWTACPA